MEGEKVNILVCNCWVFSYTGEYASETNAILIFIMDDEDWCQLLIDYLEHGKLPEDPHHKIKVRCRPPRFIHYKGTLYRRSFDGLFLRCLDKEEGDQAMEEAYSKVCGAY